MESGTPAIMGKCTECELNISLLPYCFLLLYLIYFFKRFLNREHQWRSDQSARIGSTELGGEDDGGGEDQEDDQEVDIGENKGSDGEGDFSAVYC